MSLFTESSVLPPHSDGPHASKSAQPSSPESPRVDPASWRTLFAVIQPHKWYLMTVVGSIILITLSFVGLGQGLQHVVGAGLPDSTLHQVLHRLMPFSLWVLVMAVGSFARVYGSTLLAESTALDLQAQTVAHMLTLDRTFHDTHGRLFSQITQDIGYVSTLVGMTLPLLLRNGALVMCGLVMMAATSWMLTLVALSLGAVVLTLIISLSRWSGRRHDGVHHAQASERASFEMLLNHSASIQAYALAPALLMRHTALHHTVLQAIQGYVARRGLLIMVVILGLFAACGVMYGVGIYGIQHLGLGSGGVLAFIFYTILTAGACGSLADLGTEAHQGRLALARCDALMQHQSKVVSHPPFATVSPPLTSLQFDDVSFAYPTQPTTFAVEKFSVSLSLPRRIAIVGPSGCGKSTLFKLLLRLYPLDHGRILLNGCPIQHLSLPSLRGFFAWVPQESPLPPGSVAEILRWGNPAASDADLWHALEQAQLATFVRQLPHGLATSFGHEGDHLSAGQRQRILVARALVRKAPILLLDEASSALDAHHQELLLKAITADTTTTVLMIAHRFATVHHADWIMVMDKGRLIAQGTHDQLFVACPLYQHLYETELSLESSVCAI